MGTMFVKIMDEFVDDNLRKALDRAHYRKGDSCQIIGYGCDKIFVRIGNKILDIFPSKVEIVSTIGA